jgi:hypothetical protein
VRVVLAAANPIQPAGHVSSLPPLQSSCPLLHFPANTHAARQHPPGPHVPRGPRLAPPGPRASGPRHCGGPLAPAGVGAPCGPTAPALGGRWRTARRYVCNRRHPPVPARAGRLLLHAAARRAPQRRPRSLQLAQEEALPRFLSSPLPRVRLSFFLSLHTALSLSLFLSLEL